MKGSRLIAIAIACSALVALLAAASARPAARSAAGPAFGVAEDASKYADDGGATIYASLAAAGMSENRWTLTFDGDPGSIGDQAFLDRAVPVAAANGVDIILSLYPAHSSTPDPATFCAWVGNVAARYRQVTKFVIGNEVNATRFWSPQHTAADPNAGPDSYEATLAACYDVLKQINPAIQVIGMGLAPRSVDANSTKPLDFIRAVGKAYTASKRTTPIMDLLAVHPYPNPNANPPPAPANAGYQDPGFYGIPQLDRVKQAVYDAFNGTGQPTTLNGLQLVIDEVGYQSNETGNPQYTGAESSPAVTEAQQASYYSTIVGMYSCDPSISAVLFFHLIDEPNLNVTATSGGWQSGLEYPDGSPKPAYAAVQQAIRTGCRGPQVTWSPAGGSAPTTPTSGGASALTLFAESLPAAAVDGPLSNFVTLPPDAASYELANQLAQQLALQMLFLNKIDFDPGLVFWRTPAWAQIGILIQASTYALNLGSPAASSALENLWLNLAGTGADNTTFWNWVCGQGSLGVGADYADYTLPRSFSCNPRDLSSILTARHAVRVATGRARLAKGARLDLGLRRTHAVVAGLYLTVVKVQSATNPKHYVLLAMRPTLVTASDIAKANAQHRAERLAALSKHPKRK